MGLLDKIRDWWNGDSGSSGSGGGSSGDRRYDLNPWTCPKCGEQNNGAAEKLCPRCGKRKPEPGQFSVPNWAIYTLLGLALVGGFIAAGGPAAVGGLLAGGGGVTEPALAVGVGLVAVGPVGAAPAPTPNPTTTPDRPRPTQTGSDSIAGSWRVTFFSLDEGQKEATPLSSDWTFTRTGDWTYQAKESGLGNASGTATYNPNSKRLTLSAQTADEVYVAVYEWNMDSGDGTIAFSKRRPPLKPATFRCTIKR
jgi:hypothetical protein